MSLMTEAETARGNRISAFAERDEDQQLNVNWVRSFWRTVERVPGGVSLSCTPERRQRTIVVVSGWISETRILPDGRRQIFSFLLPGDVAKLTAAPQGGVRELIAMTNVEVADAGVLGNVTGAERVNSWLAKAMRRREERLFDQIVRIGRLTAKERVLNLLLELCERLDEVGLVKEDTFRIPLTQEVIADALGLSVVHINRTLQQLRREGMLTLRRGMVTLHQRHRLASLACY